MKRSLITAAGILFLFLFSCPVFADDHKDHGHQDGRDGRGEHGGPGRGGFSGMIQAGAFWKCSNSQLETESDNETIDSLDDSADSADTFMPIALFDANYMFPTGTGIYLKTPYEDDEIGLAGGILQHTPYGSIAAGVFFGLESDVWEDPYVVNAKRQETGKKIIGGDVTIKHIGGTGLELGYKYRLYDVDTDLIGERFDDLKRDGIAHKIGMEYGVNLGGGNMIVPGVSYKIGDMDGESQSYDSYSAELMFMRVTQQYMIHLKFESEFKNYDKTHPLFHDQREDREYGAVGMFIWMNPLGWQNFFVNIGGGGEITDSNIAFYDSREMMTFMTVGYRFGQDSH